MRSGKVITAQFRPLRGQYRVGNGPGAGSWHRASGKDDLAFMLMEFGASLGGTFHQDGRCIYADDRVAICLIHETGTASGGDQFDNLAIYTLRFRPDGQVDRGWTVDLDAEHCEAFWEKPWHTLKGLFLAVAARLYLMRHSSQAPIRWASAACSVRCLIQRHVRELSQGKSSGSRVRVISL